MRSTRIVERALYSGKTEFVIQVRIPIIGLWVDGIHWPPTYLTKCNWPTLAEAKANLCLFDGSDQDRVVEANAQEHRT